MNDDTAQQLAERLAWEMESFTSIELAIRDRLEGSGQGPTDYDGMAVRYIETSSGRRLLEWTGLSGDRPTWRSTAFADGDRFAVVHDKRGDVGHQEMAFIQHQFWMEENMDRVNRPSNILLMWVGRDPLHEVLARAEHLGTAEVLGRPCESFLFRGVKWSTPQDHVYSLDSATGVPLRVESFLNEADRTSRQPVWVWSALSLDEYQGRHLPGSCEMRMFSPEGGHVQTTTSTIERVSFDQVYPAATFWPILQVGVRVFDATKQETYIVGGESRDAPARPAGTTTVDPPIRAERPTSWVEKAPALSLAIGGILLLAATFTWLRRGRG